MEHLEQRLLTPEEAENYLLITKNYKPSAEALASFAVSNFAIIAGPTGAGKDTIRNCLIKNYPGKFVPILSATTRPPRAGEEDGVQYHFRSVEYIDQALAEQRLLQADVVYSQQISALDGKDFDVIKEGQIGLGILVVQTEQYLRKMNPSLRTVFVVPPSLEVLLERIQKDRNMAPAELKRRLEAAVAELEIALDEKSYFCVINDDLEETVAMVDTYLEDGYYNKQEDNAARNTIEKILNELSK